jgi:hypothetical protein
MSTPEFNPTYDTDAEGKVTAVSHTKARVRLSPERTLWVPGVEQLNGAEVEICGTTSDGRRLCVDDDGRSAWVQVGDLEAI